MFVRNVELKIVLIVNLMRYAVIVKLDTGKNRPIFVRNVIYLVAKTVYLKHNVEGVYLHLILLVPFVDVVMEHIQILKIKYVDHVMKNVKHVMVLHPLTVRHAPSYKIENSIIINVNVLAIIKNQVKGLRVRKLMKINVIMVMFVRMEHVWMNVVMVY